ncbi:232_t:CDS:2 [Acaulospora morrowiae]|uniref:232_t:CDS:1 n=1 Tax=Acaulospora morrowiae TaxID=94023 RepID=A0A9N9AT12_9GLOM|nr:232_t:CDS:2 [Acaulospora morrowiae]
MRIVKNKSMNPDSDSLDLVSDSLDPDCDVSHLDSWNILTAISDGVVLVNGNRLQIQRGDESFLKKYFKLSKNIGEYNRIALSFSGEEVKKMIKNILENYELDQVKDSNGNGKYSGKLYTWTVEHSSNYVTLKARKNKKEVGEIDVWKHKNGDILDIFDYSSEFEKLGMQIKKSDEKIEDLYKIIEKSNEKIDELIKFIKREKQMNGDESF